MIVPFVDLQAQYRSIRREVDAAVARVIHSSSFILGREVEAFEAAFAEYVGAKFCVGVSNGTAAIQLALQACGVGPGDEVIAARRDLIVIEDAAQAHGARYKGRRVGALARAGCFSFYPGKNLGAYGEGGAVVTDDAEVARLARMLRDHGSERKYHHEIVGYNFRMEGIQGAVLAAKLPHLDGWNELRRAHAARYGELLAGCGLALPREEAYARHVYHLYVVQSDARDALQQSLAGAGVQTGIHYPVPVHLQPAYAALGHRPGDFPEAERQAARVLSLPMFPELTGAQMARVAEAVAEFAARTRHPPAAPRA
jgi:dTDP-4-amino-4,6-dideoxygalactose transaminase